MRALLAGFALSLVLAAPAQAGFAPRVHLTLDPSRTNAAPVVTASISQDPGETPAARVSLLFPPAFTLQQGNAPACASATDCPRETEIGSLEAAVAGGAKSLGTIHRGQASGLVAIVRGAGGLAGFSFPGSASTRPTGYQAITFEGLPPTLITQLTLRLTGGDRGLIRTPSACGRQVMEARVTSQAGDLAVAQANVDVEGCPKLKLSKVRISASKLRAARNAGLRLSWVSEAAGPVRVEIQRRVGRAWKRAKTLRHKGVAGPNTLRFSGAGLAPGIYRFALSAGGDAKPTLSRRFTVVASR